MKKKHLWALVPTAILSASLFFMTFVSAATKYGDISGDGNINSTDEALLQRHIIGMTNIDVSIGDLSGDQKISSSDVALLQRYLLGTISSFPIQSTITNTPTTSTTTTSPNADAWKNNTGVINLGSTISTTGNGVSVSGNVVNITSGGDFEVKGTLSNGMIVINTTEKCKLRLSGCSITNSNGPAIYIKSADKAYITLTENTINTLIDGKTYTDTTLKGTISSNDDLEFKGAGTLNITGNYNHAISGDDDITIENGIINATSNVSDCIHANDSINIKGGTLNLTATKDCIQTELEPLTIDDGKINMSAGSQGLNSAVSVIINGGTIDITKSREGVESKNITVNGGTISVLSTDDSFNSSMGKRTESNDNSQLIINGGTVFANSASGDALDSNGVITIKGGVVVAQGPQSQPNVPMDCNGPLTISGGTVMAVGPTGFMTQVPTGSSAQYTIGTMLTSAQSANSIICVKDSTGKVLSMYKTKRNINSIVFSSPELKFGSTYTIYSGGIVSGGTENNGLITGGTYNGGSVIATITINKSPSTTTGNFGGFGF